MADMWPSVIVGTTSQTYRRVKIEIIDGKAWMYARDGKLLLTMADTVIESEVEGKSAVWAGVNGKWLITKRKGCGCGSR